MADDRRIITGTHVVVKEGNVMEDTSVHKWIMKTTPGKSLGGKSIVDITTTQNWSGGDYSGWYRGDNKATQLTIEGGATKADTTDGSEVVKLLYVRNLDTTLECYVSLTTANTWNAGWSDGDGSPTTGGDTGEWDYGTYTSRNPSYDGHWDEGMYIIIPPGGSVCLRGDGTNLQMKHVRFRSNTTAAINIEYVLAE